MPVLAEQLTSSFTYETPHEFFANGDFDRDGRVDMVIVDKESGKYRLGYQLAPGVFSWVDCRPSELGDVVFVELPEVGRRLDAMKTFGVVEAVKTVSDLYATLGGEVVAVNRALVDNPALVNQAPYGEGWMIRIKPEEPGRFEGLLSREEYVRLVQEQQA